MPSYANQITLGEGKFRARLAIEGWPEIFVSDASLVSTTTETPPREQILGLDAQTIRIAASVDLLRAELTEQEQTIEIVDDSEVVHGYVLASGLVTQSLSQAPPNTTFLKADLSLTGTTITVASTSGFDSAGVVHIGTEAIRYTGTGADTFTGITREVWGTTKQAHFVGDGERLSYPKVTDRPRTIRGRRVLIYLYGAADADASAGTLRWRGIARTDVAYTQGRYAFSVEPMSWLFEQPIGGDLEEPVPIRGIYLPSRLGLYMRIRRLATASDTGAFTADDANVGLAGFWTDQESFTAALTAKLAAATSGWTWDANAQITAESDGPSGWRLVYESGDTTADFVWVQVLDVPGLGGAASLVDILDLRSAGTPARWIDPTSDAVERTLTTSKVYLLQFSAPVPRAVLGRTSEIGPLSIGRRLGRYTDAGYPAERLYLGGLVAPTDSMYVGVLADGTGDPIWRIAESVDASARSITLDVQPRYQTLGPATMVRLLRRLAKQTDLLGLLIELVADSPGLVNTGAMPLITTDDVEIHAGSAGAEALADAARDLRLTSARTWMASEGVSLAEILTHEARLIGVYPAPDATGVITWRRLRPPLPTDVAAFELTANTIVGRPSVARADSGHLREIVYRQGWDPIESEHTGLTVRVRDVQGADPTPLGGVLEVAPRSRAPRGDFGLEIDPLDAQLLGSVLLGLFGGGYRTVTAEVALTHFAATIGSVGILTTPLLPDSDGTMGIVEKAALLTGYDWSPFEGRGALTFLLSDLNIGGYAPGVLVASESFDTGDQWTITVTLTGYTTQTDIGEWYAIGDEVRVIEQDSVSPTRVSGTVDAIPSTTSVQVTFDSTWTPSNLTWYLSTDTTAAVDEAAPSGRRWAQTLFAKIGGTDGKAALASGDVGAQDFSP